MIKVYVKQENLKNEVYEVVKLFFPDKEINKSENLATDINDFLIICQFTETETGLYDFHSLIFENGVCVGQSQIKSKINQNNSIEYKKTIKNNLKLSTYDALSLYTQKKIKWGALTGVRPVRLAHQMMDKNISDSVIIDKMTASYRLDPVKAKLLLDIAKVQRPYIINDDMDTVSVYIHIPFCTTRCLYCSFPSDLIDRVSNKMDDYLGCLNKEIEETMNLLFSQGKKVDSVYIGGGTPTSLTVDYFEKLLGIVNNHIISRSSIKEYTIEAGRPDTLDSRKMKLMKEYGVNRISINPQTMNQSTLDRIGRSHTVYDIIHSFNMARELEFNCINMDIIVGLPGEGIAEMELTLNEISKLKPDNLTVHALAVKRASSLKETLDDYKNLLPQQGTAEQMADMCRSFATDSGFIPYYLYRQKYMMGNLENIGYTLPGYECLYNIFMMEEKRSIWSFGAGASSKVYYPRDNKIEKVYNVKNIGEYISRIDEMITKKKNLILFDN